MRGRAIIYSAAEMDWLERHRTLSIQDCFRGFRERFGRRDVSAVHLHALRKRKGWKTGRTGRFEKGSVAHNKGVKCAPGRGGRHPNARKTQFRKGNRPHNTKHAGHERVSKDGYVEISVEQRNPHTGFERRYVLKHLWLWEKANGPVPEGLCLKCLDGNRLNTDPTNWEPIPRATLPYLNGRYGLAYDSAHPEVKPALIALAKVKHAARRAGRAAD
ncbi:HNH endonuclease [Reyranella sp.]|uniref:HNH endonuclease n=1 Tax=Reyranella sp. TaxID=1929291 RepID=UPI003C79735D